MVAGEGHAGGWIRGGYGIISYPGRQLELRETEPLPGGGERTEEHWRRWERGGGEALGKEMGKMKQGRSGLRGMMKRRGTLQGQSRAEQKDTEWTEWTTWLSRRRSYITSHSSLILPAQA